MNRLLSIPLVLLQVGLARSAWGRFSFFTGGICPPEHRGQIVFAEHGSWNRRQPIGYRITLVRLKNGRPSSYDVFASGWLQDDGVIGRPVDLETLEDGSMLVSDDEAGRIFRITDQP